MLGIGAFILINKNNNEQIENSSNNDIDFSSKGLIVETDTEIQDTYGATSAVQMYTGEHVLKYNTEEETKNAYEKFKEDKTIKQVNVDINIELQTITQNVTGTDFESWGVYAMGLNETQDEVNNETNSNEIVVAVIDTGFDLNNSILTEQNLTSRIDNRYINITDNSKDISDNHVEVDPETLETYFTGHGTQVGSVVLDGAPNNVKILPIKIEDDEGNLGGMYQITALRYAIDQDVDVINMSFGAELDTTNSEVIQFQEQVISLIEEAIEKDIVLVAAVGNGDEDTGIRKSAENIYPASYDGVIGVSAVKTDRIIIDETTKTVNYNYLNSTVQNLSYTTFSNYGTCVDFAAPGENILCIVPKGSIYENMPLLNSGTSHASPHIAAAVATIKSYNNELTNDEVYEVLQYYTQDMGTVGKDQDYGEGFVTFKNFEECDCGSTECYKIYCDGCTNTECIYYEAPVAKTLTGIEVTTMPNRTTYTEGERFEIGEMVVTARYSDNTSQEITNYTYEPTRELQTSDTQIIISYTEGEITKTATVNITVNEQAQTPVEKTLTGIEVTTMPNRTTYTEGERFEKTGMVITAIYSDGTRAITDRYSCFPTGELSTENTQITITYTEGEITKTTTLTITVNPIQTNNNQSNNNQNNQTNNNQNNNNQNNQTNNNQSNNNQNNQTNNNQSNNNQNSQINNNQSNNNQNSQINNNQSSNIIIQNNNNNSSNNATVIPNTSGQIKDNTTSSDELAYTGIEDYIIPIGVVIIAVMAVSYIQYKKYKEI